MPKYILCYDIRKKEIIDRNLREEEKRTIRIIRRKFKQIIEGILGDSILITTYIFDDGEINLRELRIKIIEEFEELIINIDRNLLNIFEINVMICKLSTNSKIIFPDGNLRTIY